MVLRKLSKTIKGLIEEQSSYTPWPLKGQIDYNLTPVNILSFSLKEINNMMPTIF